MNKYSFKTRYGTFERVTKRTAQKLFVNNHQTIYVVGDKCRCDYSHPLTYPYPIVYEDAKNMCIDDIGIKEFFINKINSFEYYNCSFETGYHASFYIKVD